MGNRTRRSAPHRCVEFGVCRWMVDSVQIVLFGVACGVGTDAVSQELLTFLHALRNVVESDTRSWCRSPPRTLLEAAAAGRYADAADR
jgi:2-phosphoglycerate kinase